MNHSLSPPSLATMSSETTKKSRFLLRRPSKRRSVENCIAECKAFLSSKKINDLFLTLPVHPKGPWESALRKSLVLWENIKSLEQGQTDEEIQATIANVWSRVCDLVKANYYLQTHLPLERLRTESSTEYVMHAVVGLKIVRPTLLWPVLERLLNLHASTLHMKEPVQGRLPLHIAASTLYSPDRSEVLRALLEAYPAAAAEADHRNIYPLHLACQAKYPWKDGLENLYKAAAHIGELTCPCCPPELLSQLDCYDQSLDTVYARLQTDESLLS